MIQLAAWLVVCVGVSVVFRRNPMILVMVILGVWMAVPGVASAVVTGQESGGLSYHPATWLIFVSFATVILSDGRRVGLVIARHIFVYTILLGFAAIALVTTKLGGFGLVLPMDQIVGPVLLLVLIQVAIATRRAGLSSLRIFVVAAAAVESVLALIQWAFGSVLLYETYYLRQYWFTPKFGRWMGTLDHPLTLSLLICLAIPMVAGVRSAWLQLLLLAVMAPAVLATQSRTGLGVTAVCILYVLFAGNTSTIAKILLTPVVAVAGGVLLNSDLVTGVADRISNDTGSAQARGAAFDFMITHWHNFLLVGGGSGSSYQLVQDAGLITSLESSLYMYMVDFGLLFAVSYFGVQAWCAIRAVVRRPGLPGLAFAGLLAVIIPQTYNALGANTAAGVLVWTVLALCVSRADRAEDEVPRTVETLSSERMISGSQEGHRNINVIRTPDTGGQPTANRH